MCGYERIVVVNRGGGTPAIIYVHTWNVGEVGQNKRKIGTLEGNEILKDNRDGISFELRRE